MVATMNRRGVSETNYSDDEDPNPHERLTRAATTGIMEGISYLNPHEQLNRVSSSGSNISPPKRKTCIVKLDGCKYTIGSTISYIQINKCGFWPVNYFDLDLIANTIEFIVKGILKMLLVI